MTSIAFYAPIKPPDHPIPSGDRLIARNLLAAIELAGFDTLLASEHIAYSKREAADILAERKAGALAEAERLIAELANTPPDIWLTYHPYCKAPDWIGPRVAEALSIPYVTVEAACTGQGFEDGQDRWKMWRIEAQAGIKRADLHLCFKPTDRAYLTGLLGSDEKLVDIPVFFDAQIQDGLPSIELPSHWRPNAPVLITAGMMRPGKKVANYQILADALKPLQSLHWNLVLIGGGPEEATVRDYFKDFADERLHWTGAITQAEVLAHMADADLFVWPGWKEPIGMVYLEAQLMGLPVAALKSMGVPLVVHHGETGLLANEVQPRENPAELTESLANLISHPALREDLGEAGKRSARTRHSLQAGAAALKTAFLPFTMSET